MKQATKKALVGVTVGVSFVALMWFAGKPSFSCAEEPVKVSHGDTLWAIAERECEGEISFVVDFLVEQYGSTIHAGDLVWLPLDYEDSQEGEW
jgi:hypothetical protein